MTTNTSTCPCGCGLPDAPYPYGDPRVRWVELSPLGNPLHPCPGCGTPIAPLDGGGVIYTIATIDTYDDIDIQFCSPCGEVLR